MQSIPYSNKALSYPDKVKDLSRHVYVNDLPYKHYEWQERWQRARPDWLGQCAGEFFGVFCYCYAGLGSQAALFLSEATDNPSIGSLFTIGAAYAVGIAFAITTGGPSSGAQFNPAFTVAMATWREFHWAKVPRYILAQVLGAFVAGFVVYCQYRPYLLEVEAGMLKAGHGAAIISANGPAGIFAFYPAEGIPLKWVFANEFFTDFFIGLVLWGIIDFSNTFTSPATVPLLVGLIYGVSIWSYAPATAALNPARDFGVRLVATAIWGKKAWGGKYAAISSLTAFPATLLATTLYQLFLADFSRPLTQSSREIDINKYARKSYREGFRRRITMSSRDTDEDSNTAGEKVKEIV